MQRLKHYRKALTSSIVSLFSYKVGNYAMVADHPRKLLYSLVDPKDGLMTDPNGISHTKILVCWDIKEQGLVERCRVTEIELFRKDIESVSHYQFPGNYAIATIQAVAETCFPDAQLMVVLNNGIRLYLTTEATRSSTNSRSKHRFQVIYHQLPPCLDDSSNLVQKQAMEASHTVEHKAF